MLVLMTMTHRSSYSVFFSFIFAKYINCPQWARVQTKAIPGVPQKLKVIHAVAVQILNKTFPLGLMDHIHPTYHITYLMFFRLHELSVGFYKCGFPPLPL